MCAFKGDVTASGSHRRGEGALEPTGSSSRIPGRCIARTYGVGAAAKPTALARKTGAKPPPGVRKLVV